MTVTPAVLDRITLFGVLTDGSGTITFLNAAARALGDLSIGDVFSPEKTPEGVRIVKAATADSDRFTTAIDRDGRTRLVEWSPSRLEDSQWLHLGRDVTRDRRSYAMVREIARNAADASQAKMRFLATMSHEMRTPLNGILGMNGLLLDTDLDQNQRTYAEAVRQSGTALLALINDILDYSKIEAGHVVLEEQWFDPVLLVQGVTELLSPKAANKGLEIAAHIDPSVPPKLFGDEGRLRQVLLNLASNGVKFTEEGGVGIDIHCAASTSDDAVELRVAVHDTGIGISATDLAQVFEEFTQADDSRARRHEGTGLGLTIAKQIITAMGGAIDVESHVGKGSTFSFRLTLKAKGEPTALAPALETPVIVATTHDLLRDMTARQLRAVNVTHPLFARSVDEAVALIDRHPDAALLCDLPLAAAAGQRLAERCPNALVLLSPIARGRLDSFRNAGFAGYLIKPIRQLSLREQLEGRSASATRRGSDHKNAQTAPAKGRRILLAEDNQINSILAQTILRRAGHHVDIATTGQEAIDAFALAHYDIILMDMRMPVLDGLDAARRLREMGQTGVPIVALTANASHADRDACLAAGMDDFVAKPFDARDLLAVIDRHTSPAEPGTADAPAVTARP